MVHVLGSQDSRLAAGARLVLPALWLGLIVGISLIEAPLKFQAPGITIPLGLDIGRLVFTAMNWVEIVIAVILLWSILKDGVGTPFRAVTSGVIGVLILKVAFVRPLLNQRTDAVLAGVDDGGSMMHLLYIAADGLLIIGLIALIVIGVRKWVVPSGVERGGVPSAATHDSREP